MKRQVTAAAATVVLVAGMAVGAAPAQAATGSVTVINNCGTSMYMGLATASGSMIHHPRKYAHGARFTKKVTAGHSYRVKTTKRDFTVTVPNIGGKSGGVLAKVC
ncbi:hypothetical protein [Aeromicrobium sp. CTD01-1L150]|uniref:hypothetical protein n=1 Tax=Aeromicrobium sp. CTD01-1L150 TaxID=3341830 RepID=UPI0035BF9BFB